MKKITEFEFAKTHYDTAMEGIQKMEELGGPDTLEEYIVIMTAVSQEIKTRIESADIRKKEEEEIAKNKKVTREQVEAWLGNDDIIDILQLIANGEYSPENLKKDIQEYDSE